MKWSSALYINLWAPYHWEYTSTPAQQRVHDALKEGGVAISVLWIWPILVRFFGFSTRLKTAVFLVFVSCVVECFLWFCLWYSVLVNNAQCILRFFWFCQGRYIPYNRTKTLVPKEHLQLEERTACQVSLAAINGQADFEKVKISLKQNTFFQYHAAGIISCVLWP